MSDEMNKGGTSWWAVLMPSFIVILFDLLRLHLPPPTAGGLAFLAAVTLAYWLFPKTRLSLLKVVAAAVLACVVALLMPVLLRRAV